MPAKINLNGKYLVVWAYTMGLEPKQYCVDCHFFARELTGNFYTQNISDSLEKFVEINAEEREQARDGDYSWIQCENNTTIVCAFGVFASLYDSYNDKKTYHQIIAQTNRRNFCFYWKYQPTLLIAAAKILQEREAKNRDTKRQTNLAVWGLFISAGALSINAVALLVNAGLRVYELFYKK